MKHPDALILAEQSFHSLAPFCDRISIAGSVRRQRPEVKDIELVAIPRLVPAGLFGDASEVDPRFCAAVNQWPKVKGEPTGKYTQRVLPGGMKLDLFLADAENWGWILAIRTGSAGFSENVLMHTLKRRGYTSEKGYVQRGGQIVPVSEETDLFTLLKLPWMEPCDREWPSRALRER